MPSTLVNTLNGFDADYIISCGTLSTGEWIVVDDISASCENVNTITNWCQTVPYIDDNGTPGGETIFVATQCLDNWAIGFCWQKDIYLLPGVAKNSTVYDDYVLAHENGDIHQPELDSAKRLCLDSLPPFDKDDPTSSHRFWENGGGSNKSWGVPKKI